MKLATILFLIVGLAGIVLAHYGREAIGSGDQQARDGLDEVRVGVSTKEWVSVDRGAGAIFKGQKNQGIGLGIIDLAHGMAAFGTCGAFLVMLLSAKKLPNRVAGGN